MLAELAPGGIRPLQLRRVEVEARRSNLVVGAWPRADVEQAAAEIPARNVVRRRSQRRRDVRVARQIRAAEIHSIECRGVLVRRQAQHRESVGIPIRAGDQLNAGKRRGECREVAQLVGRDVSRRRRAFAAADVGHLVASHTLAVGLHLDGVEPLGDSLEPRVGDEDLLVARALDLEAAPGIAERGDVHEVVALVSRERDRVAAVLVGPRAFG